MKSLLYCLVGLLICLGAGCAHTQPTSHGIPNFGTVMAPANAFPGIYCGGEPTAAGNAYLKQLGVDRQVKLNFEPDQPGTDRLFEVVRVQISAEQQIFGNDLDTLIPAAASEIRPGTFIHCEHGKNRTQTVIGYWLVSHGVPKARAQTEMERFGWGDSLPGLKWYWRRVK